MCGIAGIVNFNKQVDIHQIKLVTDQLSHRGPNDSGCRIYNSDSASVGFGHRRLSIQDLSNAGHQPYEFENLRLIFNGEIYNFKDIREDLKFHGYSFSSNSDTEVLIKAFHKWGIDSLDKLNGMFAFAIFDCYAQKLYMARDRAGVKPFYLYMNGEGIAFASELKAIHKVDFFRKILDYKSVSEYFTIGYIQNPDSIFECVQKIKPGNIYTFCLRSRSLTKKQYWSIVNAYNEGQIHMTMDQAIDHLDELVTDSCKLRMIADVPIGIFLSGGYDSSLIAGTIVNKLGYSPKTYTIGFEDGDYDESMDAKEIANYLGTDHHNYIATASDFRILLEKLPYVWDEPIADSSTIPTLLVSEVAATEVKAVLSADGGDELFGGYDKYPNVLKVYKYMNQFPVSLLSKISVGESLGGYIADSTQHSFFRKMSKLLSIGGDTSLKNIFYNANCIFNKAELKRYTKLASCDLRNGFNSFDRLNSEVDNVNRILAADYLTYQCDDILTKVDRATMSVGLEGREPLLDYRIAEFAAGLNSSYKIVGNERKLILKKLAHRYVPKKLLDRPKRGFGAPIYKWLKNSNEDIVRSYLSRENLIDSGIYNVKKVLALADSFYLGKPVDQQKLWSILNYEMWRSRWYK